MLNLMLNSTSNSAGNHSGASGADPGVSYWRHKDGFS